MKPAPLCAADADAFAATWTTPITTAHNEFVERVRATILALDYAVEVTREHARLLDLFRMYVGTDRDAPGGVGDLELHGGPRRALDARGARLRLATGGLLPWLVVRREVDERRDEAADQHGGDGQDPVHLQFHGKNSA